MNSNVVVGKKRKWSEVTKTDPSTRLKGKFHHCVKELRKTAKKAKSFEIQRLVKRLREARKSKDNIKSKIDVAELEAQMEILKKIDLDQIADIALASKIRKDKLLSSNQTILNILDSPPFSNVKKSADTQTEKVESKMLSSAILASGTSTAINGLKNVLNPQPSHERGTLSETGPPEADLGDEKGEDEWGGIGASTTGKDGSEVPESNASPEDDVLDIDIDEGRSIGADGWESGSVNEEPEEAVSEGDVGIYPGPTRKKREISRIEDNSPPENNLSSQFLPSLSVGYVRGDSDSDFSSDEEEQTVGKKNRRGQRARQAIWEKKYGKNAKHLKTQQDNNVPVRNKVERWGNSERGINQGRFPVSASARPTETKRVAADSDKPLHPSWEAKRKLKSKESTQILRPQGKKIIFN